MNKPTTHIFKGWLRDRLTGLVSVQRAAFTQSSVSTDSVRDVDLIVYTWAGMTIHIHLIDEPTKTPKVRRIIENATGSAIPTLFMLDAALLPQHGERDQADRWYVPFQALANDRAYAYVVSDSGPAVYPVQFKTVSRFEIEAIYGAALELKQIRHYKINVKHNALKGYWLLADFETEISAKTSPFRTTAVPPFPNGGKASAHAAPSAPKTRLELSYELLGVVRTATREEVKAAFRKLAFEVHPDVSELPKPEAEARFKQLSEAYEYIKTANEWG